MNSREVAVITGASAGVGRATVRELAKRRGFGCGGDSGKYSIYR